MGAGSQSVLTPVPYLVWACMHWTQCARGMQLSGPPWLRAQQDAPKGWQGVGQFGTRGGGSTALGRERGG
jgi:hypothetical protein